MAERDEEFEEWYRNVHGRVVNTLTVIVGDVHGAAEAADEAFVRALERWDRVRGMAAPEGWVFKVAVNVARRRARRSAQERDLLSGSSPAAAVPSPDWSLELWDAMRSLPERERTAVALFYVADLGGDEIAQVMKTRPGTVWSTLNRGRQRLRDLLDDEEDERSEVENA